MDEEIEEVLDSVKPSESQKSVATSNVYSMDFTDSSSEIHNSSGMETYVLEWDSEGSESPHNKSLATLKDQPTKTVNVNRNIQCEVTKKICQDSSTSFNRCSIVAQEIFTQTSKTIIELAETDGAVVKSLDCNTLETQTSFISIRENKTVAYRIEMTGGNKSFSNSENANDCGDNYRNITCNQFFNNSLEDCSSKLQISETEYEKSVTLSTSQSNSEKEINIINEEESSENVICELNNEYDSNSDFERSSSNTDIEEDSLMEPTRHRSNRSNNTGDECDTPKSVDRDVAELYTKLNESMEFQSHRPFDQDKRRFGHLTPLTEETAVKKDSITDTTFANVGSSNEEDRDVLFTNNAGIKVKLFPNEQSHETDVIKLTSHEAEAIKLPPIQSNPNNANMNFLYSLNPNKITLRSAALPCVYEERRDDKVPDRWEIGARELASGESPLISVRSECDRAAHGTIQLPPIHLEGNMAPNGSKVDRMTDASKSESFPDLQSPINIKDKIKELKMSHKARNWNHTRYSLQNSDSRSGSPSSNYDENKATDTAERGCELLCTELLKRLRSASWFDVTDTLDDIPRVLEKFWCIIAEHRIADLLRQVTAHVESPRTQVARAACNTLAAILKNTNYTKKPDFHEAVTILLVKTGSFCRPVRRAANVALDEIVCGVDLSHVITALCIHGATHKSALVRCASARLLVVCCALGRGGRDLMRARPPTAACARRHALRSLAALLEDKSTDTRKYAERLYSMLRPLTNFEAYYLTDVEIELASRQMKKYDQLLLCGPPPETT